MQKGVSAGFANHNRKRPLPERLEDRARPGGDAAPHGPDHLVADMNFSGRLTQAGGPPVASALSCGCPQMLSSES